MDLASFTDEFLHNREVYRLMAKVQVRAAADLDRHFPEYWPGRVSVGLSHGDRFEREIIIPKGERGNPMLPDEVEAKFLELASPILGETQTHAVMQEVRSLEDRDSIQALISSLRMCA